MSALTITAAGPGVTLQDAGRPGLTALGLSRGGATDPLALAEAAALLGDTRGHAIEMAAMGATFQSDEAVRIALTGAEADARIGDTPISAFVTHLLPPGVPLVVRAITSGVYAYLSVAGGFAVSPVMGGVGTHLLGGIGKPLTPGDALPLAGDPAPGTPPRRLRPDRGDTGPIRVIPGPQTDLFPDAMLARFEATEFTRSPRGNRQGVRLDHDGDGFATADQLALVSDFTALGDIQMTGDGRPFVLMSEHQTTGGYPRIGTVLPADLPRIAQAPPGATLTFRLIGLEDARSEAATDLIARLTARTEPLTRDPRDIANLLDFNLIGGVTAGDD